MYILKRIGGSVRFDWDGKKEAANFRKQGIHFRLATRVFEDPHYVTEQDREVDGEERWQTMGMVGQLTLLVVAHTVTDEHGDVVMRVISARRATSHERRRYESEAD